MVDITMCCNYDCPIKSKCYRYRAVPNDMRQSFAMYKPKTTLNGSLPIKVECEYFWEVDIIRDKILPTEVVNNRYERDNFRN